MDDVTGQAVLGDAHVHHAARHGQVFEDHRFVAAAGQEVAGRETGRSGPDDGHLLATGGLLVVQAAGHLDRTFAELSGGQLADLVRRARHQRGAAGGFDHLRRGPGGRVGQAAGRAMIVDQTLSPVGGPALDVVDGDRLAGGRQGAVGFAGMRTRAADDGRQRVVALDDGGGQMRMLLQRLEDVGGAVHRRRAGGATRGRYPAVRGLGLAGGAGGVGGEVLFAQVQQRQDRIADGVGYAAPRGIFDGFGQAADLGHDALAGSGRPSPVAVAGRGFAGVASSQLLEQLTHDVHADAAGPAAPARLFLDELDVPQGQVDQANVTVHNHAAPGHDGLDLGHVGLLQTGRHFIRPGPPVPVGQSRDVPSGCGFRRLGHCFRTSSG